jgi:uncharacterized membrane-anchored protein
MKIFKIYIKTGIAFMLWIAIMNYVFDTFINREVNVFLQIGLLSIMAYSSYLLAYYIIKQIHNYHK